MGKRGAALILTLMVIMVLTILLSSFFLKTINENNLVKRHIASVEAFWLAETGIAEEIEHNLPGSANGTVKDARHAYSATASSLPNNYYNVVSTGTVTLPSGGSVSKTLNAVVKTGTIHPEKFKYAIDTTTDLVIKGSVAINPAGSAKEYDTLNFADLFGYSKTDIRDYATHLYTPSNFGAPLDGITWVDVPSGQTINITSNLVGSGILIVNGNVHFAGTLNFSGIIYVIGELTITGTVVTEGSVLAESSTTVDTELKGNPTLNYDIQAITDALNAIKFLIKTVVSWKEI